MEKSSIEKIRRLLEISERERHCRVLLTLENISVVRHNPDPYTLPVIPRPLRSHVVESEHFVIADLRRIVSGGASSSRNLVIEASSRAHVVSSTSRPSASSSGGSSSSLSSLSERIRSSHPERLLLPVQVIRPAPRGVKVMRTRASGRRNAPGSKGEDFMPWVPTDTEGPQDLEEEERHERMTGLLDRYAARKRKLQVISSDESDAAPIHAVEPNQPTADDQPAVGGSSGDQAIVIPCFLELGPIGRTEPDGAGRSKSNEDGSAPTALQVIPPSNQADEQPGRLKYMRSGLPRPSRLDQVITDSYLPPRGPEPPEGRGVDPWGEGVKDILSR